MYCRNCGKKLNEGDNACSNCGTMVNTVITEKKGKNKVAAGVLAILLGTLGIHNFYLGYNGKAIAQLLMTVLSCGILAFVSYIWSIVEGIQIFTGSIDKDAAGNPLVD